ncbi:Mal regulon transcriptional regulator MalI [Pantoea piersonii]|uniref:Mal regulon transcriptional regulator MalI n=1 Tax=Pantoea piersonii TaxID=2364647 RepID=UPI00242AE406|nr:Mal regulon transcriptional regulator MalI [Pantoea piersonii]
MTQQKVTINDVAEAAGVSVTTVSLVLSGKGRISPATVARVNQAIEQSGYVRNRSAASLRGGASGVIGLIVRDLSQRFYAEMTAGLSEALETQDKMLVLAQSGAQGKYLTRCFDALVAQGVDGIVLGGDAGNGAALATGRRAAGRGGWWRGAAVAAPRAAELGLPLICASRASYLEGTDSLRPDNALGARMATEYLIRQGHQHIAWLGGSGASLTRAERIGGCLAPLLRDGFPFYPEWIIECEESQNAAAEATTQLLQRYPRLTAIIAANGATALGSYFALLRSGRTLGKGAVDSYYAQQMALVGFSDEPQANLSDPPLTFICSPAREMGRAAAARILLRISAPETASQHMILTPSLITSERR